MQLAALMHFTSFVRAAYQNFVISTPYVRKAFDSSSLQMSYTHLTADQNAIRSACCTVNLAIPSSKPKGNKIENATQMN